MPSLSQPGQFMRKLLISALGHLDKRLVCKLVWLCMIGISVMMEFPLVFGEKSLWKSEKSVKSMNCLALKKGHFKVLSIPKWTSVQLTKVNLLNAF